MYTHRPGTSAGEASVEARRGRTTPLVLEQEGAAKAAIKRFPPDLYPSNDKTSGVPSIHPLEDVRSIQTAAVIRETNQQHLAL